ncbi:hypothetical protein BAE44_0013663, partial [Dichanthelium oligosanthes]
LARNRARGVPTRPAARPSSVKRTNTGETDAPPPGSHAPSAMSQRPEAGSTADKDEEQRLRAALRHLQAEAGVLERLVYKHRNQHRGAAYFQYLLKVRRDLKLLLGTGLAEVLNAVFPVLACRKPANTILVPTKQTKKKPGANHSHHERLLGVARLLSQMAEPVMKAAISVFFACTNKGPDPTVFAVDSDPLVLVSQMLLDAVSIYNKVTHLTDRKQAVKISIGGAQAFREYYPSMNDTCTILECVWVKDKFVLHEKLKDSCQETQVEDQKSCGPESSIQYETLALVSEAMVQRLISPLDNCKTPFRFSSVFIMVSNFKSIIVNSIALFVAIFSDTPNLEEMNRPAKQADTAVDEQPDKMNYCSGAGGSQSARQLENESGACSVPDILSARMHSVPHMNLKHETRKRVAFVAVGNPKVPGAASETKSSEVNKKQRLDMISHTPVESELYSKLLDSENAEKSIL